MTTVHTTEVAERFVDALSRRDFAALDATFAEDGRLRGLVPTARREAEGPEVGGRGITRMNLVCSGERPAA